MSFKITDFKKTTRTADGERLLYPYQIRDDRYTASIGYATAYYERMIGRRRAEFEAETLLEFFGDARLARGLVACLARQGKKTQATRIFKRACASANDLGLFAEEYSRQGREMLGNFPQGLTHLSHIGAALSLLDVRHPRG